MRADYDLKKLVQDIFPEKYLPGAGIITNVDFMEPEKFESKIMSFGDGNPEGVRAFSLSWGIARRMANLPPREEFDKTYGIWVKSDWNPGVMELSFVLLHEVGHIDYKVNKESQLSWKGNEELYCDVYALDRLSELYGRSTGEKLLMMYGSKGGWGEHVKDTQENVNKILH